jgi:hypothetical protein
MLLSTLLLVAEVALLNFNGLLMAMQLQAQQPVVLAQPHFQAQMLLQCS